MTAVDWDSQPEPWRWVGPEFAAECLVLAEGGVRPRVVPNPVPSLLPSPGHLRWARLRLRLNLKRAAYILGVSEVHLTRLERGGRAISACRPELRARIRAFIDSPDERGHLG
jgi:hypothetical protein